MKTVKIFLSIPLLIGFLFTGCAQIDSNGARATKPKEKPWLYGIHIAEVVNAWGLPGRINQSESGVEWCSWYWDADGNDYQKFEPGESKEKDGMTHVEPGKWVTIKGDTYTVTCGLSLKIDITGRVITSYKDYPSTNCNTKHRQDLMPEKKSKASNLPQLSKNRD